MYTVEVAECPSSSPNNDDFSITILFVGLSVISVAINCITIVAIIYLIVKLRKSSNSPKRLAIIIVIKLVIVILYDRASQVHEAVEMQSRNDKTLSSFKPLSVIEDKSINPEPEYALPSITTSSVDIRPRIRNLADDVKLQKNPSYQVNKP